MPDHRRDCPNCEQRIHPLELSDLYRGRLLNCGRCGQGLYASVTGWASAPVALLAWWALVILSEAVAGSFWLALVLGALFAWLVVALVRIGLVFEGAPWVKLSARDKPWKPQQQSWVRSLFFNG